MKVNKFKAHFNVRLTPTEFEALKVLAIEGKAAVTSEPIAAFRARGGRFRRGYMGVMKKAAWKPHDMTKGTKRK